MKLKNAINEIFDCAKAHENDILVGYARIRSAASKGEVDNITVDEIDRAKGFIDEHYKEIVEARKTGDWSELSEALGE